MKPARPSTPVRTAARGGFTLFELMITGILLAAVMSVLVPLFQSVQLQRRAAERRQFAQLEAGNILERFAARDWERITAEQASQLKLSEEAREVLPDAELDVAVTESQEEMEGRRITVAVQWTDRTGRETAPVRLTTWVYRAGARRALPDR